VSQHLRDWAKQALEMLEDNHHLVADNEKHVYVMMHLLLIERGKALLEQPVPVQEPKQMNVKQPPASWNTPPAQPAPVQEPLDLQTVYDTIIQWDVGGGKRSRRELARRIVDLYITPPAQPAAWVGLDEDEVEDCAKGCATHGELARAIEAKLREKNGGGA